MPATCPSLSRAESRELLREYVPLRTVTEGVVLSDIADELARAAEIRDELWAIAEGLARTTPDYDDPTVLAVYHASYTESLNETIDVATTREVAAIYARVPETVLLLLFVGSALTLGMVGFSAGLTGTTQPAHGRSRSSSCWAPSSRSSSTSNARRAARSRSSQVPLVQLQEQIGPPTP